MSDQESGIDSGGDTREAGPARDRRPVGEHPSVYCPNCSNRLDPARCELVCKRCGYYMSCADYV